jgi:hypothetical protein
VHEFFRGLRVRFGAVSPVEEGAVELLCARDGVGRDIAPAGRAVRDGVATCFSGHGRSGRVVWERDLADNGV